METFSFRKRTRNGIFCSLITLIMILGLLLGVLGVIVILNPLLGLGVIGVVVGCGMITAGINLIFLSTSVWLL